MSPTKKQSFTKALAINNRSYNIKLNIEDSKNSILTFNVIDQTDSQNPQIFSNKFSLNQDDNAQQLSFSKVRKIINF